MGYARSADQLLASRRLAGDTPTGTGHLVIFGHTAFETPLVWTDRICVDTGAVYGNMLTALELPAMRFHHA
jgi:serine/threonine protein phosphatase 1